MQNTKTDTASQPTATPHKTMRVALTGNPNSGKTTLFNALTGLRQRTANYPGVTVERKSGYMPGPGNLSFEIIDLPGLYSLAYKSIDEKIAVEILMGTSPHEPRPDIVVFTADATNLARSLYLSTQIIDLGLPVIIVSNMMDVAEDLGWRIDIQGLAKSLGVPVIPAVAKKEKGLAEIRQALADMAQAELKRTPRVLSPHTAELTNICSPLVEWLLEHGVQSEAGAFAEALRIISTEEALQQWVARSGNGLVHIVQNARKTFTENGIPWKQAEVSIRYAAIDRLCALYVRKDAARRAEVGEKIDRWLTHRIYGPVIMFLILATIFQSVFTWAEVPMMAIENGLAWLGTRIEQFLSPGPLQDLLVNGVIAGVGSVLVFLPQIMFLFFFLTILEDTGYLARVAFIMDRFLAKIGLSGQSIIPLLSSFACAIPGIMATRTLQNQRDRLITIMVAPFMSCSARLPVYTLMIGAFIPNIWFGGIFFLPGIVLLSMYFLGIFAAFIAAAILQKFLIKGETTNFIMELPLYKAPVWKNVFLRVYEAGRLFITNAGKIILAVSIVMWFLASYPKIDTKTQPVAVPELQTEERAATSQNGGMLQLRQSYAGKIGRIIEPAIAPLGLDWKIGIGLITSFAAREVIVSTLATIYNLQDSDETSLDLRTALRNDVNPVTNRPVYTPLVAISLMVFFVLACQCMSTIAVVRRETNSWRWPALMFVYMLTFAYVGSFTVYQVGSFLGY